MMNLSTRAAAFLLPCTAVLALTAATAQAQPYDHLKCYKAKDQKTFKKAAVDLTALQTQFGVKETCEIKAKAKLFCVPSSKMVTAIEGGLDMAFPAEDLVFDRLCYKLKCPAPSIASEEVSDQFGTRRLEKFKASLLCTPAVEGPAPTTTSTTATTMPACVDMDLDTYGTNCPNGPDCDDSNPAMFPGNPEICDGLDNDCNGMVDDGVPEEGNICSTGGAGICAPGRFQCQTGVLVCAADASPTAESCDGLDNDCDGVIDNGNPGGGQACDTGLFGVCASGTTQCDGGTLVCAQTATPTGELCDALDNDCDGSVDEGVAQSCGSDVGECVAGTQVCIDGSFGVCQGQVGPAAETCNGLDDDCDGATDNGFDLASDPNNCGTCGVTCAIGGLCTAGACECPAGQTDCNGVCIDTGNDTQNCGECGMMCAIGESCSAGVCIAD